MTTFRAPAGPAIQVRSAGPADHEAIQRLTLDAYGQYATLLRAEWPGLRRSVEQALANRAQRRLVAEQHSQLLGSVMLVMPGDAGPDPATPPRPDPELQLLAVSRRARGLGVGRRLIEASVVAARQAGAVVLSASVPEQMHAARALLLKSGFVRVSLPDAPGPDTFEYRLGGPDHLLGGTDRPG